DAGDTRPVSLSPITPARAPGGRLPRAPPEPCAHRYGRVTRPPSRTVLSTSELPAPLPPLLEPPPPSRPPPRPPSGPLPGKGWPEAPEALRAIPTSPESSRLRSRLHPSPTEACVAAGPCGVLA